MRGVAQAIARSRAVKIYICNLMTQPGETTGFSASDHLRTIDEHCGFPLFDAVLLNTAPIPKRLQKRYLAERSRPVPIDLPELMEMDLRVVTTELVSVERLATTTTKWVRHDPDRLARTVLGIAASHADRSSSRVKRSGGSSKEKTPKAARGT